MANYNITKTQVLMGRIDFVVEYFIALAALGFF